MNATAQHRPFFRTALPGLVFVLSAGAWSPAVAQDGGSLLIEVPSEPTPEMVSTGSTWVPSNLASTAEGLDPLGQALRLEGAEGGLTLTFTPPAPGSYRLEIAYPAGANARDLAVNIEGAALVASQRVALDPARANTWQELGTYTMADGSYSVSFVADDQTAPQDAAQPEAVLLQGLRLTPAPADAADPGAVAATTISDAPGTEEGAANPFATPAAGSPAEADALPPLPEEDADSPFAGPGVTGDSPFAAVPDPEAAPPFEAPAAPESPFAVSGSAATQSDGMMDSPFIDGPGAARLRTRDAAPTGDTPFDLGAAPVSPDDSPFASGPAAPSAPADSPFTSSNPAPAGDSPFNPFATAPGEASTPAGPLNPPPAADPAFNPFDVAPNAPAESPFAASGTRSRTEETIVRSPEDVPNAPSAPPRGFTPTVQADRLLAPVSGNFAATGSRQESDIVMFEAVEPEATPAPENPMASSPIDFLTSLEDAQKRARQENKPILLVFSAETPAVADFRDRVLNRREVVDAAQAYVPVHLDIRYDNEVARRFNVTRAPYIVVLNKFGYTKAHVGAMPDPKRLARTLADLAEKK